MTEFTGSWRLRRLVWDGRGDRFLRGEGTASFTRLTTTDWRLREDLFFDGRDGYRETIWSAEKARLSIRFADGLPLVDLVSSGLPSESWHLCGEDRYCARLIHWSGTSILLGWRVLGPRKDYVMLTRYARDGKGNGS